LLLFRVGTGAITPKKDLKKMEPRNKTLIMEMAFKEIDMYLPCLKAHAAEITKAVIDNDFCALQQVFVTCGIPKSKWRHYLHAILDCADMQAWGA